MPQFVCSYAHDIACFADFVVEANSEKSARRKIGKALKEGRFVNVAAEPCWENGSANHRVFVQGIASEYAPTTTLEELIGAKHRFSPHNQHCIHCGQHVDDEAVDPQPCHGIPLATT